jgi:hypothetical protein
MTTSSTSPRLLCVMLRAQHLAKAESPASGYAMVITSIVTLMMFSLLAAALAITNLNKSSTNAYMEGNSTFYASESGLNQRSNEIRQKFVNYSTPNGTSPGQVAGSIAGIENMSACFGSDTTKWGTGDFACQKLDLNYNHASNLQVSRGADGKSLSATDATGNVKYTAYTFASDRTVYTDPVRRIPQFQTIPAGQLFAGLSAQTYRYTIYSAATSKQAEDLDARASTVLEMTFQSRVIPLFQFAAFYDGDLEMNSTSQMNINGRVHTNANLYLQPVPLSVGGSFAGAAGAADTKLLGLVTVVGNVYNRVDAIVIPRFGDTQVLISGDPNSPTSPTNVYEPIPAYDNRTTPLISSEIAKFNGRLLDGGTGVTQLRLPQPGFLRKRDGTGAIGEYYGKADLRLEMFPKRAVPFNFTAIRNGITGGTCAGFDLSADRQGTDLNCIRLNEGQLRSLQQPVMVKVVTTDERNRFCPTLTTNYNPAAPVASQTLRALQVAIAAQNTPIPYSQLSLPLNDAANTNILNVVTSLGVTVDPTQSPVTIAAGVGGCFLAAPIQQLASGNTVNANYDWQSSYYDRRENRWIGMLQTNIASLTVWNRDGVYVSRDNDLNSNDPPTAAQITAAFNTGAPSPTYDTNNLLFVRAPANVTAPTGSFRRLGMGSSDTTEGGLVFHATVSDDLDGDGTNETTIDAGTPTVPSDNIRKYLNNAANKRNSPYGFAFNGGADLPAPLTVVTDQAIYVQGDYDNFAETPTTPTRQPASIIGDTITVLSNSCLDTNLMLNCGILAGQNNATPTTVNAAFLSFTDASDGNLGSATTTGGAIRYSGGLNNYMRMVENWGVNFNYTGSFVSLGAPQEFSGAYRAGCNAATCYYMVPIRNFNYDLNFNAANRLPPLTPRVIYLQQDTFKRSYK